MKFQTFLLLSLAIAIGSFFFTKGNHMSKTVNVPDKVGSGSSSTVINSHDEVTAFFTKNEHIVSPVYRYRDPVSGNHYYSAVPGEAKKMARIANSKK